MREERSISLDVMRGPENKVTFNKQAIIENNIAWASF